jgi:glycosyltransferase involved in cell wall biosynthesis
VTITGTVGELTKNKNQISLIEEARKNPSMYVAIVGEGDLRPYLEEKIREYKLSDRVKLFGYIPARDVLKGFDVFTLPSNKESLGFSILEARIAGLPVIANRVGGIPEAIDVPLEEFSLPRMIERTLALYTS